MKGGFFDTSNESSILLVCPDAALFLIFGPWVKLQGFKEEQGNPRYQNLPFTFICQNMSKMRPNKSIRLQVLELTLQKPYKHKKYESTNKYRKYDPSPGTLCFRIISYINRGCGGSKPHKRRKVTLYARSLYSFGIPRFRRFF